MTDKRTDYSAGIITECSWFLELKKIMALKLNGATPEEIKRKCLDENLFGMATENRVKRIYRYLIRRADTFDEMQTVLFNSVDLPTQKIMNLISILRGDRLFFEFINDVYREKCIVGYQTIDSSDVNIFFRDKSVESESLQGWKESTVKKVGRYYLNFMCDANLLRKEKKIFTITPPILDAALEKFLQDNGETHLLKAITGVR